MSLTTAEIACRLAMIEPIMSRLRDIEEAMQRLGFMPSRPAIYVPDGTVLTLDAARRKLAQWEQSSHEDNRDLFNLRAERDRLAAQVETLTAARAEADALRAEVAAVRTAYGERADRDLEDEKIRREKAEQNSHDTQAALKQECAEHNATKVTLDAARKEMEELKGRKVKLPVRPSWYSHADSTGRMMWDNAFEACVTAIRAEGVGVTE